MQLVTVGGEKIDIGGNPSTEGGDEDEGVEDQVAKVIDVVFAFRLQVCILQLCVLLNSQLASTRRDSWATLSST